MFESVDSKFKKILGTGGRSPLPPLQKTEIFEKNSSFPRCILEKCCNEIKCLGGWPLNLKKYCGGSPLPPILKKSKKIIFFLKCSKLSNSSKKAKDGNDKNFWGGGHPYSYSTTKKNFFLEKCCKSSNLLKKAKKWQWQNLFGCSLLFPLLTKLCSQNCKGSHSVYLYVCLLNLWT